MMSEMCRLFEPPTITAKKLSLSFVYNRLQPVCLSSAESSHIFESKSDSSHENVKSQQKNTFFHNSTQLK